jgi:uncharacterized protein YkwD
MQVQRQLVALLLALFLLLVVPFNLMAQAPLPKTGETAVGEPLHFTISEQGRIPAATDADRFTFLPFISGGGGTSSEAGQVVELVNVERAQIGCPPLQISLQLTAAAQGHSADMALNDYFSHTSLDGRSPWDRIRAEGYNFWSAAENIAAGYPTPTSVVAAWMDSDGHRANILNCDLEDIGVGYFYLADDTGELNYRHYWTQDFGTRK